ncbi:hypothetical protein H5410_001860 [Solanum commersonii]|uniref:CSD domain-containing protein n=1 Tax=Solanum commersonii TaxID=4109 RepID=A0A9J6B1A6_SOLCO|nr:hypothetical protein H5410_001860 [Solanum commersonii]
MDDGGNKLFVHQSSIRSKDSRSLTNGEAVEFDVEYGNNGHTKAINVAGPDGALVKGGSRDRRGGGGDSYGGGGGYTC